MKINKKLELNCPEQGISDWLKNCLYWISGTFWQQKVPQKLLGCSMR